MEIVEPLVGDADHLPHRLRLFERTEVKGSTRVSMSAIWQASRGAV